MVVLLCLHDSRVLILSGLRTVFHRSFSSQYYTDCINRFKILHRHILHRHMNQDWFIGYIHSYCVHCSLRTSIVGAPPLMILEGSYCTSTTVLVCYLNLDPT